MRVGEKDGRARTSEQSVEERTEEQEPVPAGQDAVPAEDDVVDWDMV